jgi:hypothetical protein
MRGAWFKTNLWVAIVAILAGAGMLQGCSPTPAEGAELYERVVEGNVFDTTPVRGEVQPLRYRRGSFEFRCNECHTDFQNPPTSQNPQGEHRAIMESFSHGINTMCSNCHHPENREVYVDYDMSEIPADQPQQVCQKCHGPTYRDWEHGVHGRQNGHWDRTKGDRTKLICTQCHDPHHPKFQLMKPDPAPVYSRFASHDDPRTSEGTDSSGEGTDH